MRKVLFFLIFICAFTQVYAQDVITTKKGEDIQAIVQEIGPQYVIYKLFEEPDGVTYSVCKSDLFMIRYESGRKEVFGNSRDDLFDDGRNPVEGIQPNMKYKQLKKIYNYKNYTPTYGDRVSPGWCGVASFFIPGLGECINNEWGRGVGKFFGGIALMTAGSVLVYTGSAYGSTGMAIGGIVCSLGALAIDIWSIVDAVRISKVRNMYIRDLNKLYPVDLKLYPSVQYSYLPDGVQSSVGFTLAMNF